MKAAFTDTLVDFGSRDPRLFVLGADLMRADGTVRFQDQFPERTINVGVAEANMVGIAAGLSARGKIPVAVTFACFATRRAFDQFFISGNYALQNIKLVGSDPGITASLNGGTHMPFEDMGMMRGIPGMTVCEPCDGTSLSALLGALLSYRGCTYLRTHRKQAEKVHKNKASIELGRGVVLRQGGDVTLIAAGVIMVPEALKAAELLAAQGINATVVDMHTLKPLDKELVLECAQTTQGIVTCENHQITNGLGSAVAEVLAEEHPTRLRRVGVRDRFGQVGSVDFLKEEYGLTASVICNAARELLAV